MCTQRDTNRKSELPSIPLSPRSVLSHLPNNVRRLKRVNLCLVTTLCLSTLTNAKTSRRGWRGRLVHVSPWRGQATRIPDTHNALASAQKSPTFNANNVPTHHHRWPPLPGKCDGERVSQPTSTPPGREADLDAGPEVALAQYTDSASGRHILLTVLAS